MCLGKEMGQDRHTPLTFHASPSRGISCAVDPGLPHGSAVVVLPTTDYIPTHHERPTHQCAR
jgi:hypothetical protein